MSAAPEVINPQNGAEITHCWKVVPLVRTNCAKGPSTAASRLMSGDASSSGDEFNTKVRKPYTITKQRERWTENEHQKFLEALKLYGRAWRRIEEHIGTKTAVQIRSHAQKFFSKLEREASTGNSVGKVQDIEIPPPRPKRKPSHPYPKKSGNGRSFLDEENRDRPSLSSASLAAVNHASSQSAAFTPYIAKGGPTLGAAAFHGSPLGSGHFFGPQGSVKLFGKTVAVPETHKPASQKDSIKECVVTGEPSSPSIQTNKVDLKQNEGLSPFLKVGKKPGFLSVESLSSDKNGFGSATNTLECTDESIVEVSADGPAGIDEPETADSRSLYKGRSLLLKSKDPANEIKIGKPDVFPPKFPAVGKTDVQFPNGGHQNNPMYLWMDNFFRSFSGLSVPAHEVHGPADGLSNDHMTHWHFMQVLAMNYAAYAAAMAAAAAAGWTAAAGGEASVGTLQDNTNESHVLPPFGDKFNASSLTSAAASWWSFRGLVPPGYHHPPTGALCTGERDSAANVNATEHVKTIETLEDSAKQKGDQLSHSETGDEVETMEHLSELVNPDDKEHTERRKYTKNGCMWGTSCLTEAPRDNNALPDSESQPKVDASIMLVGCPAHESDTERIDSEQAHQNLCSSSDEFQGGEKKSREGSSSGSNTPVFMCHLGESEIPSMLESKNRESDSFFKKNDVIHDDTFENSYQERVVGADGCPKIRSKHIEKGRKHQQRDIRHGGSEDCKRLKSCAQDMDSRKEVSQEGRKAFQALFTCKTLPQTFLAANRGVARDASFVNEHVSRPMVSKNDPTPMEVEVAIERVGSECINTHGSPLIMVTGEGHMCGNLLSITDANSEMGITDANSEMGIGGFGTLNVQHDRKEVNTKAFTVSSRSGFVPYQKPLCAEPKINAELSSL